MTKRQIAALVSLLLVAALVWQWAPAPAHLREFDPAEVARLETAMWRAYYEHHPAQLFILLVRLLRDQYGMRSARAAAGAYLAAHAAVVFQRGAGRADYEKALPDLRRYYAMIRRDSDIPFDADRAAAAELEWWIAHRDRRQDLVPWLARLQSEIYGQPPERFQHHAELRAQAMLYRDAKGSAITESDWTQIDSLLRESWQSLRLAVVGGGA